MAYIETRENSAFAEEYSYRADMGVFNEVFMKAEIRLVKKLEKRASEPTIIDEKGNLIQSTLLWHGEHKRMDRAVS